MKTAMEELNQIIISRIIEANKNGQDELSNKLSLIHSWIVYNGIAKEREQIEKAFDEGDQNFNYFKSGDRYYRETFNK